MACSACGGAAITSKEYREELALLASGILDDCTEDGELDEEAAREQTYEAADGHQWIIYTRFHFQILQVSDNASATKNVGGLDGILASKGVDGLIQFLAFCAFARDLSGAVDAAIETFNEAKEEREEAKEE